MILPVYPNIISIRQPNIHQTPKSNVSFKALSTDDEKNRLEQLLSWNFADEKEIPKIIALIENKDGSIDKEKCDLLIKFANRNFFGNRNNITAKNVETFLGLITDKNGKEIKTCTDFLKQYSFNFSYNEGFQDCCIVLENLRNKKGLVDDKRVELTKIILSGFAGKVKDIKPIFDLLSDKTGELNSQALDLYKKIPSRNNSTEIIACCKNKDKSFSLPKIKLVDKILNNTSFPRFDIIPQIIQFCQDDSGEIDMKYFDTAMKLSSSNLSKEGLNIINDLKAYLTLNHISELNFRQKRDLLEKSLKYGENICSPSLKPFFAGTLLPKNHDSYLYMIAKLSNLLGLNVKELTSQEKQSYFNTLDTIDNPNSAFYKANLDNTELKLKYSKTDFINDVMTATSDLSSDDRRQVLDFYSFEIIKDDNKYTLNGFPNTAGGNISQLNSKQKNAVNNIRQYVDRFVNKNHIFVSGNSALEKELNNLLSAFPEFYTIIGKKQHETHDYTLDIHSLKVLQEVIKNPYYQNLSKSNQRMLKNCALMHDISKEENIIDRKHPVHSALDTFYLTSKFGYSYHSRLKMYQLIKNHDWLGHYARKKMNAKDIAFELRQDDSFRMSSILTASDLKAIKKNNAFYDKCKADFKKAASEIQYYVDMLKKTSIHLPQTKLTKASEVPPSKYVRKETHNGITNTVIYINPKLDLSKVGFKNVSDVNDLNVLLHGLDNEDQASMFQVLGNLDSDALLSTSYMTYSQRNFKVFRKQGFVLKVASDDIHVAYCCDFGSGYKKNLNTLKKQYLFRQNNGYRDYISSLIKSKMHLSDSQYIKMFPEIENKPIEVLRKTNPKFAKVMEDIFAEMEGTKRQGNRQYNEILVTRPQIQGIFCYDEDVEDIPKCLRKYAAEHDMPVLKFCS